MSANNVKEAADAMAALYVMSAVVGLLEGGAIAGGPAGAERTADKIIKLCKREQQRQFARYENAQKKGGGA